MLPDLVSPALFPRAKKSGATGLPKAFTGMPDTPENRRKFIATVPTGRLSEPEDVANAALFPASGEAAFISGVEFPVDGARTF